MESTHEEMAAVGQFCVQFTFFLSEWNQAEATARRILQLMLGESRTAMALAVELQNRSLQNAIRTGADDPKFSAIKHHILHLVTGYDRLLGYRNYYAHSLLAVNPRGGVLLSISAKGVLKLDKALASMNDLDVAKQHVSKWIGYAAAIEAELGASGEQLKAVMEAYQSSLEKPQWPAPLKKTPILLQER